MASQEFELERRRELQSAMSSLTTALWQVDTPPSGDPAGPVPLDKPVNKLLRAAGYPADVARLVGALLAHSTEEPGDDGRLRARDLQTLLETADDGNGAPAVVQRVLKAAGYPADVSRRVLAALEPPAEEDVDPQAVVKRALRAAGYAADVSRSALSLLDALAEGQDPQAAVKVAVKAAGYPADVARRVLVALEPPVAEDETDPQAAVKRAARAAGYPADVVRRVAAALEPPAAEDDADPETAVRHAVRAAGYPADTVRRVVAALEPPAEKDPLALVTLALKSAGYPADLSQLVRLLLASSDGGPEAKDAVPRVIKKAGYPPDVSRLVLSILERHDAADPADGLPLRDLANLVDAAGDAGRVVEPVRRVLLATGYPPDIVALVGTVLDRFRDPEHAGRGLHASDLQPLLAPVEDGLDLEPMRRILRAAGYRKDLVDLVFVLLDRYGDPDLVESGLRVSDLRDLVEPSADGPDPREPVHRILRGAGYRPDLINLVSALLDRFAAGESPTTGVRIRDLAELVEDAPEDLLSLVRTWRTPSPDAHMLSKELATVLGRRGIDIEFSRDIAAVIARDPGHEYLAALAQVARFSLTAEDSCISMAEPAWREDPRFADAYAEAKAISAWGRDIRWRVQTLVKLAAAARHLEGDFVECGVDTGGTARAVMAYLGDDSFQGRTFYLFDTFDGVVPEQLQPDEPMPTEDRFPGVAAIARTNFADKPYARIVEGAVPETLPAYTGSQVAYLHIDMNAAYPEVEAFRHFWDLLTPGAPVVFDDYGFPRHRAQRRALDEAAAALDVEIMMLPTCQGIVFKPPKGV